MRVAKAGEAALRTEGQTVSVTTKEDFPEGPDEHTHRLAR